MTQPLISKFNLKYILKSMPSYKQEGLLYHYLFCIKFPIYNTLETTQMSITGRLEEHYATTEKLRYMTMSF